VEESNEARIKFANAKAISSSQFFGDKNEIGDADNQVRLQKFAVSVCFFSIVLNSSLFQIINYVFIRQFVSL
jgi:hypothetical protein